MKSNDIRIALVTGASSGIGAATAELLARSGYRVYGTSRHPQQDERQPFEMLSLDVTDSQSVDAAVMEVMRREGRIDLLVNNAGFGIAPAAAEESSLEQARAIFETNFFGLVRMTRAVLPHMRRRESGRIVNIGSALGFLPLPYLALYSATKHAVAGYSEALDQELRTMGIRVSLVEPAYTKTQFEANVTKPDMPLEIYASTDEAVEKKLRMAVADAPGPGFVAEAVLRAATSRRPKTHYVPGLAGRLRLLRRFAPSGILEAAVRRDVGLSPQATAKQALL